MPAPSMPDRCAHGALLQGEECPCCELVWHTEMLALAEASVARHKAALARLRSTSSPTTPSV